MAAKKDNEMNGAAWYGWSLSHRIVVKKNNDEG